ncbi:MAG TPA: type II CRISPR-associated endonuclease Cas1 [Firmicutes bacterium]|nr:type II CRISPR-associated endonuclease Cas1 [Bacillota bacterium]
MSWRTVVVSTHSKLEYKMGYLVCRNEQIKKIHLSEISTLIVESTAVSFTAALVCELIKNKINIVFCDEQHNPHSQLLPLNGSHDASKKLKTQIEWNENIRNEVWTEIVANKIYQQAKHLKDLGCEQYKMLYSYIEELQPCDVSNREGHAAKVYFNALFGLSFSRNKQCFSNSALDYGYAIILSAFNRAVVANGYNTQMGLYHRNEFNPFNFSCDLMEPFRVLVDRVVFSMAGETLDVDSKRLLQNILNIKVSIVGKEYSVSDAINIYCKSVFNALCTGDLSQISFYEL